MLQKRQKKTEKEERKKERKEGRKERKSHMAYHGELCIGLMGLKEQCCAWRGGDGGSQLM